MNEKIASAVVQIERVSKEVPETFGDLSFEQLNWKQDPETWSVAQCLDHLIKIDGLYFPLFEEIRDGRIKSKFWERISPLSGFFGRYLVKVLSPDYANKVKTSKKAYPSASDIEVDVIERFQKHNKDLIGHMRSLPAGLDLERTIITSPLASFVTYSLGDCITLLSVHEQRHFEQAKRVMASPRFPG